MASFMDKADGAISTLSFALTYSVLLSTDMRRSPSLEREGNVCMLSFDRTFVFLSFHLKTDTLSFSFHCLLILLISRPINACTCCLFCTTLFVHFHIFLYIYST